MMIKAVMFRYILLAFLFFGQERVAGYSNEYRFGELYEQGMYAERRLFSFGSIWSLLLCK
jgi:hypothetical protein